MWKTSTPIFNITLSSTQKGIPDMTNANPPETFLITKFNYGTNYFQATQKQIVSKVTIGDGGGPENRFRMDVVQRKFCFIEHHSTLSPDDETIENTPRHAPITL